MSMNVFFTFSKLCGLNSQIVSNALYLSVQLSRHTGITG